MRSQRKNPLAAFELLRTLKTEMRRPHLTGWVQQGKMLEPHETRGGILVSNDSCFLSQDQNSLGRDIANFIGLQVKGRHWLVSFAAKNQSFLFVTNFMKGLTASKGEFYIIKALALRCHQLSSSSCHALKASVPCSQPPHPSPIFLELTDPSLSC